MSNTLSGNQLVGGTISVSGTAAAIGTGLASGTLVVPATNSGAVTIKGGRLGASGVDIAAGAGPFYFANIDLSAVTVEGTPGDSVTFLGDSGT